MASWSGPRQIVPSLKLGCGMRNCTYVRPRDIEQVPLCDRPKAWCGNFNQTRPCVLDCPLVVLSTPVLQLRAIASIWSRLRHRPRSSSWSPAATAVLDVRAGQWCFLGRQNRLRALRRRSFSPDWYRSIRHTDSLKTVFMFVSARSRTPHRASFIGARLTMSLHRSKIDDVASSSSHVFCWVGDPNPLSRSTQRPFWLLLHARCVLMVVSRPAVRPDR